jgi:hypothetical protein
MNNKDFAIGVLAVTATVLLTAVLLLSVLAPPSAYALAQLDQGLGYTMFTVQVSGATELLNVINQAAGLMNIYRYDISLNRLVPLQQIPLPPVQTATPAPAGARGAR